MKVLYFVSLFPCWSETFIVREMHELIRMGVDVRIVSLKHPQEKLVQDDARALDDRVTYPASGWRGLCDGAREIARHPLQSLRELGRIVSGLSRHPRAMVKTIVVWWRVLALMPRIREAAPAHLHAHWATYPSTAAFIAHQRLGIPYSFTAHAHDIFLEHHLLADKIRSARCGVTISRFNCAYLSRRLGMDVFQRFRVVHCGVPAEEIPYREGGRRAGLVVSVGRLDEIKGFPYLIDACKILDRRGLAFQCVLIGEGRLRRQLEQQIAQAGLEDKVLLPGAMAQEQVRRHLYEASVFVLPSVVTSEGDRDGIPVALMEAMACGAPVVSTFVSGIPELIEPGIEGLLVEPRDAEALADAMEKLLTQPRLASALARNARAKVERDFDVAKEARKLYEAFA